MISKGRQTNSKNLYKIECDVGANKNAGQAFSMPRLSSQSILDKSLLFCLLAPDGIFRREKFLVVGFHVEVKLSCV